MFEKTVFSRILHAQVSRHHWQTQDLGEGRDSAVRLFGEQLVGCDARSDCSSRLMMFHSCCCIYIFYFVLLTQKGNE